LKALLQHAFKVSGEAFACAAPIASSSQPDVSRTLGGAIQPNTKSMRSELQHMFKVHGVQFACVELTCNILPFAVFKQLGGASEFIEHSLVLLQQEKSRRTGGCTQHRSLICDILQLAECNEFGLRTLLEVFSLRQFRVARSKPVGGSIPPVQHTLASLRPEESKQVGDFTRKGNHLSNTRSFAKDSDQLACKQNKESL